MSERIRVLFFGTPEFSVTSLKKLVADERLEVVAVVTQPDAPQGRGLKLKPSPVKTFALESRIPVLQPHKIPRQKPDTISPKKFQQSLDELGQVDVGVVVSYGKILPRWLLSMPAHGMLNVHPSLLPRWRGAAPIEWTLFSGDRETGVSIMLLDEGMDTGPVFTTERVAVLPEEDKGALEHRLGERGAEMLLTTIIKVVRDGLEPIPQEAVGVTYAERWFPADCKIRWEDSAHITLNRVRASSPDHGGVTTLEGKRLKVFKGVIVEGGVPQQVEPGRVSDVDKKAFKVRCGDGKDLAVLEVQLEGKKRMAASDFLRGVNVVPGMRLE